MSDTQEIIWHQRMCGVATAAQLLGQAPGTIIDYCQCQWLHKGVNMVRVIVGTEDIIAADQDTDMTVYRVQDTSSSYYLTEAFIGILNSEQNHKLGKNYHAEHEGSNQFSGNF